MILPTKGVHPDRAMFTIGGEVIDTLQESMTVSGLWTAMSERRAANGKREVAFEWFILTLDMLYAMGVVTLGNDNFLTRHPR